MSQTGDQAITRICPQCGRVIQETWVSCPFCGRNLAVEQKPPYARGLGIASIVLGVLSLIIAGIPLGIAAIICGSIATSKGEKKGVAGIVLGIIGAIIAIILIVTGVWKFIFGSDSIWQSTFRVSVFLSPD